MNDENKTKEELIKELRELRQRKKDFETSDTNFKRSDDEIYSIFNAITDMVTVQDTNLRILSYNKAVEKVFGKNLVGKLCYEVYQGRKDICPDCAVLKSIRTKNPASTIHTTTGAPSVEIYAYPIFDEKGEVTSVVEHCRDITEKLETRVEMMEINRLNEILLDLIKDGLSVIDTKGIHIDVNPAFCQMTGFTKEEFVGTGFPHIYWPEEEYEKIYSAFHKAMGGELDEFELIFKRKNGERFPVILKPSTVTDEKGNIINYIATIKDISERKKVEVSLKESEERFRILFENSIDSLFILDIEGNFIDVNRAAYERLGYTKEEMLSMHITQLDSPEFADRVHERFEQVKKYGNVIFESAHLRKDGTVMPIEVNTRVIDYKGEKAIFSVIRDISMRKKADKSLIESERRFRGAFENAAVGASMVDLNGRFIKVNRRICEMLGYSEEELLLKTFSDITHPDDIQKGMDNLRRQLAGEADYTSFEKRYLHKDGHILHVIISPSLIRDNNGNPLHFVGLWQDITERRKSEEKLRAYHENLEELVKQRTKELTKLNEQLRQSQKIEAIGLLAGGIAHDFGNILATIKGSIYIIQKKLGKDSPLIKYAEQIIDSITKANNITKSLLTFSKKQVITKNPVALNEIVIRMKRVLLKLIGNKIELDMVLTDRNTTIMADSNNIEQVLINLVSNSKDAMPDGGKLSIKTDIVEINEEFIKKHYFGIPGEYALMIVSDTGIGIDWDIKEKIFEPFFSEKEIGKGTGLGLAITYGIIKQHNGYIDVYTETGQGTTFKVYLPVTKSKIEKSQTDDMTTPVSIDNLETILISEDDTDTRNTMTEVLKLYGYTVLEAKDGEEAIRVFSENKDKIQLVLLDLIMPKKSGTEVYSEIKRIRPDSKVLFISSYIIDSKDINKFDEDKLYFISKFASPEETIIKIQELLNN